MEFVNQKELEDVHSGSSKVHFNTIEDINKYSDALFQYSKKYDNNNFHLENHMNDLVSQIKKETNIEKQDNLRTQLAEAQMVLNLGKRTNKTSLLDQLNNIHEPDGGATFNPKNQLVPTSGFCYSPYPQFSQVADAKEVTAEYLLNYTNKYSNILNKENHFLGLWNNPEDGKVYIDISINTINASETRKECLQTDQIAYFDLQTFESVTVNSDAKSGQ